MHGEPALPAGFSAFPYVNPDAPKGGRLVQGVLGTFDSLNPFIVKGSPAISTRGYVIESLMARGYDEPFTLYGLIARTVETDAARTYVTFAPRPARRGFPTARRSPPTTSSFPGSSCATKAAPTTAPTTSRSPRREALDARTVRFDFAGGDDRELPLILGLMPVLPKHAVDPDTFEETSLKPPARQRTLS